MPQISAAVPKTGTWYGDHSQVFDAVFPGSAPTTYKTKMVIVEYERRIASVAGYVRMRHRRHPGDLRLRP